MFKKILIANRGEIAVRIIRACKEWGIPTVAVHSDVDRESMHVRMADESVCIGSHQPANSYLNIPALMSAIELTNADAVHPGYGFLSENANFAKILEENKINFIGASSKHIEMMGDKIQAKKIAKENGLPVIEGSEGGVKDVSEAKVFVAMLIQLLCVAQYEHGIRFHLCLFNCDYFYKKISWYTCLPLKKISIIQNKD